MLHRLRGWALPVSLLTLTILLGVAAGQGWIDGFDRQILAGLVLRSGEGSDSLVAYMQGISWFGGGTARWVIVILLCLALWRWASARYALALGLAVVLSNLSSSLLKILFARPRPDLSPHLDPVSSFSYPSGHAASAAALYLTLALLASRQWRGGALVLAFGVMALTGLSRMLLGVHWPSDILGGTLLGAAFAFAAARNAQSQTGRLFH